MLEALYLAIASCDFSERCGQEVLTPPPSRLKVALWLHVCICLHNSAHTERRVVREFNQQLAKNDALACLHKKKKKKKGVLASGSAAVLR